MSQKADLNFDPSLENFHVARALRPITVLSGPNNSGKSLVLKWMKQMLGRDSYMVGANRFYHVYHIQSALRDPNEVDSFEQQFQSQFWQEQFNYEQNAFDLQRVIVGLSDTDRDRLFELCGRLIGSEISLRKLDPDNDLSMRYIDVDGQNLSVASTGTRVLLTTLGICMDKRFSTVLIDEPELGLAPRVQQSLATFLHEPDQRAGYLPHLEQVYVATHSHLFLARTDVTDNFVVTKTGLKIDIRQVTSVADFHRLQFNLLGNSLEAMYLPAAIVIVEGTTDYQYIDRLLNLRFPGRRVTVISSGGDVKRKVAALRESLGDLQRSPFRERTFVVLDAVHQPGLGAQLLKMGVPAHNIVAWNRNGVEYLYPRSLLCQLFNCSDARVDEITIVDDRVRLGDIEYTKVELARRVIAAMGPATIIPDEVETKLLIGIAKAID